MQVTDNGATPLPGTPREFERACLPFQRELMDYATRLTRSRAAAQDITQTTYLRAWQAWPDFRVENEASAYTCIRGWLYKICVNVFRGLYRQMVRHGALLSEHAPDTLDNLHGGSDVSDPRREVWNEPPATRDAALASLSDEVLGALDALDTGQREVVERADFLGWTYKDIAKALSIPIGTVMSRLHRARRTLAEVLAEYASDQYGIRRAAEAPQPMLESPRCRAGKDAPALHAPALREAQPDRVHGVMSDALDQPELVGV